MKKETPKQWLEKRNEEAEASVPVQDAATKKIEQGIEESRKAMAAAQEEREADRAQRAKARTEA